MKQALLFSKAPELVMLWDAAERAMIHALPKPTVASPPPRRTMHLTPQQIKSLEEYRKFKTYKKSKEYTDLQYLFC